MSSRGGIMCDRDEVNTDLFISWALDLEDFDGATLYEGGTDDGPRAICDACQRAEAVGYIPVTESLSFYLCGDCRDGLFVWEGTPPRGSTARYLFDKMKRLGRKSLKASTETEHQTKLQRRRAKKTLAKMNEQIDTQ